MGVLNQMSSQAEQNKPSRRNIKKVSWVPETNLCQVRLFLAEDAPLEAGQVGVQDLLQSNKRLLWHPMESGFDYDLDLEEVFHHSVHQKSLAWCHRWHGETS